MGVQLAQRVNLAGADRGARTNAANCHAEENRMFNTRARRRATVRTVARRLESAHAAIAAPGARISGQQMSLIGKRPAVPP